MQIQTLVPQTDRPLNTDAIERFYLYANDQYLGVRETTPQALRRRYPQAVFYPIGNAVDITPDDAQIMVRIKRRNGKIRG